MNNNFGQPTAGGGGAGAGPYQNRSMQNPYQ
jgi:hypothetical protein